MSAIPLTLPVHPGPCPSVAVMSTVEPRQTLFKEIGGISAGTPERWRHASFRAVRRDGERPRPVVSTQGTPPMSTGGTPAGGTTFPAPPTTQGPTDAPRRDPGRHAGP
jgi:hypothetical protein